MTTYKFNLLTCGRINMLLYTNMSTRRRKSSGSKQQRRSSGRKRRVATRSHHTAHSTELYNKGRTSQVNENMSLAALQGVAWRNGIPFGGLNKHELLRKIQNTT